jgi:small-conductance mechanosensitive channel
MESLLENARGVSLWIVTPVFLALWIVVLTGVRKFAFSRIHAFAARTTSEIDDVLVNSISLPATILILASGLLLVERILPLDANADKGFQIAFGITGLLVAVLFFDRLIRELIRHYSSRFEFLETSRGILVGLARAVIISVAIVIFLDSMGVSITPLVASLGIGSLAVALALRDTLANFFAGLPRSWPTSRWPWAISSSWKLERKDTSPRSAGGVPA